MQQKQVINSDRQRIAITMRIAFFGTSDFVGAVQEARFLRRLIAAGTKPVLVVTAPDASGERGREPVPGAVKAAALEFGLPVLQPSTLQGFSEELEKREIELSLVVAYGKILPPDVLAVPRFGSLSVHPSLLPRWRGPTPIQATILAGDPVTGVTTIQMDSEIDHGPIIAKRVFPLGERAWTAPELSDALTDLGVELFLAVLEPWVLGKIVPQPQDHEAATYCRMLKKEDGRIDWSKSAEEVERMVRAFQLWPGAYAFWQRDGKQVRLAIESGDSLEGLADSRNPAGAVLEARGALAVQTGSGVFVVRQLKLEGKRSMAAPEFLRGHPDIIGVILA